MAFRPFWPYIMISGISLRSDGELFYSCLRRRFLTITFACLLAVRPFFSFKHLENLSRMPDMNHAGHTPTYQIQPSITILKKVNNHSPSNVQLPPTANSS